MNSRIYMLALHGYIVGSYAAQLSGIYGGDEEPNDIDIIIRPEHWNKVFMMLPQRKDFTKLGGVRFTIGGQTVDVWPQTLENYLTTAYADGGPIVAHDLINKISYHRK